MRFLKSRNAVIASSILLLQMLVYYRVSRAEVIPNATPWSTFPEQIGAWRGMDAPVDQESMDRLHPDDYLNRVYSNDQSGGVSSLFVAYFKTQRDGRAPHSPRNCLPGAGWESLSNVVRPLDVSGWSGPIPVNEYIVQKDGGKLVVHYWFQQDHRVFASEFRAQFYALPEMLVHGRTDIALIRIITPVTRSLDAAEESGLKFAASVFPLIRERLR
ncbi:MAG: EpsI family protein [Acidobacteriaceae bacterium]|nr:EpsI family protein [Acidobacteriaceae bacterium]